MRHQLTWLSQLPAIKKFCGSEAGLKARLLMESSGGETTSKSFIGLCVPVAEAAENMPTPPPKLTELFADANMAGVRLTR